MIDKVETDAEGAGAVGDRACRQPAARQPQRYVRPLRLERSRQLQLSDDLGDHVKEMPGRGELFVGKFRPGLIRRSGQWCPPSLHCRDDRLGPARRAAKIWDL